MIKKQKTIQFSDYKAPSYSEIKNEIDKIVGKRPELRHDEHIEDAQPDVERKAHANMGIHKQVEAQEGGDKE